MTSDTETCIARPARHPRHRHRRPRRSKARNRESAGRPSPSPAAARPHPSSPMWRPRPWQRHVQTVHAVCASLPKNVLEEIERPKACDGDRARGSRSGRAASPQAAHEDREGHPRQARGRDRRSRIAALHEGRRPRGHADAFEAERIEHDDRTSFHRDTIARPPRAAAPPAGLRARPGPARARGGWALAGPSGSGQAGRHVGRYIEPSRRHRRGRFECSTCMRAEISPRPSTST